MTEVNTKEPLDVVARQIEAHAKKSEEQVISAAMLVREARRRVEAGEAGKISWYDWAPKNISLSLSRLRELQSIAAADDPEKELERQRKLTQKRGKEHRAKKKATGTQDLDPERQDLINWAKEAPIDRVKQVLGQIRSQLEGTSLKAQPPEATQEAA